MYQLSKLSKAVLASIASIMNAGQNRTAFYITALAYVLARNIPLPAAPVGDSAAFFRLTVKIQLLRTLSDLNEIIPFDTKETARLVEAFFQYRLNTLYPKLYPLAFRPERGVEDFFGLSSTIPEDTLELIKKDPAKICTLINILTPMVEEISKSWWAASDEKIQATQNLDNPAVKEVYHV